MNAQQIPVVPVNEYEYRVFHLALRGSGVVVLADDVAQKPETLAAVLDRHAKEGWSIAGMWNEPAPVLVLGRIARVELMPIGSSGIVRG